MELKNIKGVGPKTLSCLNSAGIYSVRDLLYYFPRDYEDRGNIKPIFSLNDGDMAAVEVEVAIIFPGRRTANRKKINRIGFKNDTGCIVGVWFNQPYINKNFKIGEKVILYGRIKKQFGETQIVEPQYERESITDSSSIIPIYPLNKYLNQNVMRRIIQQLILEDEISNINEFLPEDFRRKYNLMQISKAIKNIHFPDNFDLLKKSIKRLKFQELFFLQLALFKIKNGLENNRNAIPINPSKELVQFKSNLPFALTNAQARTIREILIDMKSHKPMNRLVQGDVGSGKTIVAITALFNCAMNGFQSAMMAPTEILAEQHYISLKDILNKWNINIELLTGSTPQKKKEAILEDLKDGNIDIIVGTHALIQDNVDFKNLALVITDEQHRFGVRQRASLVSKGHNPHVLVMTATPIPRTLALFLYGDMDISIIDELPPGRQKINTYFVKADMRDRVYNFLKKQIKEGRQCYVICPLVEESENLEAESVEKTYELLKEKYFKENNVGILYGKMNAKEKDDTMRLFKDKKIDLIVSTTVIEVGINVPNATVIVIENAERFGLAQLHQLRGRVGRGSHQSYCILIADTKTPDSEERMKIMTKTNDGFIIAEKDMEIRGTGEFFGVKQSGLPEFKLANPIKDIGILKETRDAAKELVDSGEIYHEEFKKLNEEINGILSIENIDITFN